MKEVKKATAHLRGSALEDDAVGPDGIPPDNFGMGGQGQMKKLLQTKVEKSEIDDLLRNKSNKRDVEMALR